MKEIYCDFQDLTDELANSVKESFSNAFDVEFQTSAEWIDNLDKNLNFTNQFQLSLFHEGFLNDQSPDFDNDPNTVLFIKIHEANIYGDESGKIYFHGFISSWDTRREPGKFYINNCTREEIDQLVTTLKSSFPLIMMG